jgi:hypothetical protein
MFYGDKNDIVNYFYSNGLNTSLMEFIVKDLFLIFHK